MIADYAHPRIIAPVLFSPISKKWPDTIILTQRIAEARMRHRAENVILLSYSAYNPVHNRAVRRQQCHGERHLAEGVR